MIKKLALTLATLALIACGGHPNPKHFQGPNPPHVHNVASVSTSIYFGGGFYQGICFVKGDPSLDLQANGYRLHYQTDGNYVYTYNGVVKWFTGTFGGQAEKLCLQSDGNQVIYSVPANHVLWTSHTGYGTYYQGYYITSFSLELGQCQYVEMLNSGNLSWPVWNLPCE